MSRFVPTRTLAALGLTALLLPLLTPTAGARPGGPALPGRPLSIEQWLDRSRGTAVILKSTGDATTLEFAALAAGGRVPEGAYVDCTGQIPTGALKVGDNAIALGVRMQPAGRLRIRLNVMPGAGGGAPGSRHNEFHAFATEVDVTAGTSRIIVPLKQFRLMWAMNGTPAFDPTQVTGIGLEPVDLTHQSTITVRWVRAVGAVPSPAAAKPATAETAAAETAEAASASQPAASRIAFNSDRSGNLDVWIMDGDGRNLTQLTTDPGFDLWPALTPSGDRIVWMSNRGGGTNYDLFSIAPDGSGRRNLTDTPGISEGHASISPDGQWIAFSSDRDGDMELYRMRLDGTAMQRLTHHAGPDGLATFSPDGDRLIYAAGNDTNHDLFCLDLTGKAPFTPKQLTTHEGLDTMPAWSPDGRWIAFCSDRGGRQGIYRMRPDGTEVTRISPEKAFDAWPGWSPDGTRLVFQSMVGGNFEVLTCRTDGSDRDQLVRNPSEDRNPTWGRGWTAPVRPVVATPAPGEGGGSTVVLHSTIAGYTGSGAGPNPQRYPFEYTGQTTLSRSDLDALGREGAVPDRVAAKLAAAFVERADDAVDARCTVREGRLTGAFTITQTTGNGRGKRMLTLQVSGSAAGGVLQLTVESAGVQGTWNWGGGVAALNGKATVTLRLQQTTATPSPQHPHKH